MESKPKDTNLTTSGGIAKPTNSESLSKMMERAEFGRTKVHRSANLWEIRLRVDGGDPVNFAAIDKSKEVAFTSLLRMVVREYKIGTVNRDVLILEDNPDVRGHLGKLFACMNTFAPVGITTPTTHGSGETVLSIQEIEGLLRARRFTTILIDGDLGLGLGQKMGDDGKIIAQRLSAGEFGELNRKTPMLSIFGDHRINGSEPGIVNNSLALGLGGSGIWQVLDHQ